MISRVKGRVHFLFSLLAWAVGLSLLAGGVASAAAIPAGAATQVVGNDTLFFKLDVVDTSLSTGTQGVIRLTVGTTTSEGYGFEFPNDLTITLTLPSTKGVLFTDSEFSKDGFNYKPTNSRRTLTIKNETVRLFEYFTIDVAIMPTVAGDFPDGKQTLAAGSIKGVLTSASKKISLTQVFNDEVTVTNTNNTGSSGTRSVASGSGTATASIRGGAETLSLKLSNSAASTLAVNGSYPVIVEFWSTKNPFTIPKGSTLTLTLPADSPVIFPDSYNGFGAGGDYFVGSLTSGQKSLVLTAAKDLSNSEHRIEVNLALAGTTYDANLTSGGKMTAKLELKGVAVSGSWPTASTPNDIPIGLAPGAGTSTWSIVGAKEFTPATLNAVIPLDAVDALTGSASYVIELNPGSGTLPAKQIRLTTKIILPEGLTLDLAKLHVDLPSGDGFHVGSTQKELSDGVQMEFTVDVDASYEMRGLSIPITIDAFMVAWDAFNEQPMVASMVTTGSITPQGAEAYSLKEQTVYVKINTPDPYDSDQATGDQVEATPMKYQGLSLARPNALSLSGNSVMSPFQGVVKLVMFKPTQTANNTLKAKAGELGMGMLRPFGILPSLLEVSIAGLATK